MSMRKLKAKIQKSPFFFGPAGTHLKVVSSMGSRRIFRFLSSRRTFKINTFYCVKKKKGMELIIHKLFITNL